MDYTEISTDRADAIAFATKHLERTLSNYDVGSAQHRKMRDMLNVLQGTKFRPIEQFMRNGWAINGLIEAGFYYIEDLYNVSDKKISKLEKVGPKALREIKDAVSAAKGNKPQMRLIALDSKKQQQ